MREATRQCLRLVWIAVKLAFVTAMLDRAVAQFIYAGF